MFSEITRIRPACARRPEAAMPIDLRKSMAILPRVQTLALAHRGLQQAETARVERGCGLIIHLVLRNLEHLVVEADGIAGRARLGARFAFELEAQIVAAGRGDVARIG